MNVSQGVVVSGYRVAFLGVHETLTPVRVMGVRRGRADSQGPQTPRLRAVRPRVGILGISLKIAGKPPSARPINLFLIRMLGCLRPCLSPRLFAWDGRAASCRLGVSIMRAATEGVRGVITRFRI